MPPQTESQSFFSQEQERILRKETSQEDLESLLKALNEGEFEAAPEFISEMRKLIKLALILHLPNVVDIDDHRAESTEKTSQEGNLDALIIYPPQFQWNKIQEKTAMPAKKRENVIHLNEKRKQSSVNPKNDQTDAKIYQFPTH